jgi:topoisomerase-4 subunit A
VYKRIEAAKTEKALRSTTRKGMEEWRELMVPGRELTDEDIQHLLELRIRRISAYDLERSRAEVDKIRTKISEAKTKLKHLVRTTIHYVEGLLEKYGDDFPRRTHITRIEVVDKKAAATQSIRLAYDRESGFFGSQVKGERFQLNVSEFDLILAVAADGSYRVMPPPDKMLFESRLLYCEVFDPEEGVDFTVVYRDKQRIAYAKRIHIEKFIRNKEYQLIKDKAGKLDVLVPPEQAGKLTIGFAPAPRQRVKQAKVDLRKLEVTGVTARGVRLAPKPVNKVKHEPGKARAKKASAKPVAAKPARTLSAKPARSAKKPGKGKPPGGSGGGQGSLF